MNQFKITEPGFYRTQKGEKVKAVIFDYDRPQPHKSRYPVLIRYEDGNYEWVSENGKLFRGKTTPSDIIAKWEGPTCKEDLQVNITASKEELLEAFHRTKEDRNWKRDALYYEACLRWYIEAAEDGYGFDVISNLQCILEHRCRADDIDLTKPNYGMFE